MMENEAVSCRTCLPGRLDSPERLALLKRSNLLDEENQDFQRLTELARDLLDVPVVLTSLVDIDRQVFPAQTGLPEAVAAARQTPLSHSFCQHVVTTGAPLIVEDARCDERVKENRAIEELGVIAYAGFPIISEGQVLGSFCVIRPEPHTWTVLELQVARQFSESVSDRITQRLDYLKMEKHRDDLEASNRELRQLSDVLAHDLKAPLRGIKGMLGLIQAEYSPEDEVATLFGHVMSSAGRMEELVDALNDYSAAFARFKDKTKVDLDELVREVQQDLKFDIESSKAEVIVNKPLGSISGYAVLLRQLFQNFISNALKFQPSGQSPKVVIGSRKDGVWYVKDNGIGITEKNFAEIFLVYKKLHHESEYKGTGMGLAVCYRVVREHGGRIWMDSKPGEGSTFFFTLQEDEEHVGDVGRMQ